MKINKEKTKLMLFNTARTRDFSSILEIEGEQIEVVEQQKLLGVQIPNYLKWNVNASYIVKRGYNKLWMIRRLKGKWNQLTDIYCKHVRSILEYAAAAVWHAGLTLENPPNIE